MTTEPTAKHQEEAREIVTGDTISRAALLTDLRRSHATCIKNADDRTRPEAYRKMMEHFAEAGRQFLERIEEYPSLKHKSDVASHHTRIREVLEMFPWRNNSEGMCWCWKGEHEQHAAFCLAAKALWETVKE